MAPGISDPTSLPFPDSILRDLLDVSLTGVNVLRPVYDPGGEIVDFAIEYLNLAGQRMTGLSAQPGGTLLTRFPSAISAGILAYYRRAYADGDAGRHEVNYQADGLDNFFRLAARRSGEQLVVSFTDTSDQDRSAVELALRESQAAERAARAEAEQQRTYFQDFIEQAPVAVAVYRGPEHRVAMANATTLAIWGRTLEQVRNRPVFEALPEAATPEVVAIFEQAYATGNPHTAYEQATTLLRNGRPEQVYWNIVFEPQRGPDGHITGIFTIGTDVTEQVRARQQLEQFNQELETRVEARTQEALALQADLLAAARQQADQRDTLYQVFEQTAGVVALLREPGHCYEYVNPAYQAFFPGRPLVGRNVADAVPELVAQGFVNMMNRVYRTGETYFGQEVPFTPAPPPGQAPRTGYFNFTYQAYREHGAVAGISIFAYDVTEQVLARRQREAEREQLHQLFMEAPAPIVIFDGPRHVFQLANPVYQRMFPGRELLGKPVLEALPELVGTSIEPTMDGVYETGTPFVAQEMPLQMTRTPDGPLEDLYFTFTFQARRNDQGLVDGILMFGNEVTDQVLARRVVEARETSFRQLADHVPGTLWVTNPAGECTYLSARWYATTGQTQAEGLGLGWTNAVHPDDAPGAGAAFLAANARREPFSYLFRLRQRDGAYRWVTDQGLPRYDETGAYEGMVGAVVDVHEQKLAELALQRLTTELGTTNEQLTRTNVDLDNFIYTASHDLKAPISNIEGLLYLLQEELPAAVAQDAEVGPTLTRMLDSVDRFKRTIGHLTDVSKLQKEHAPAADRRRPGRRGRGRAPGPGAAAAGNRGQARAWTWRPSRPCSSPRRTCAASSTTCSATPSSTARPTARPHVDVRAHVRAGPHRARSARQWPGHRRQRSCPSSSACSSASTTTSRARASACTWSSAWSRTPAAASRCTASSGPAPPFSCTCPTAPAPAA